MMSNKKWLTYGIALVLLFFVHACGMEEDGSSQSQEVVRMGILPAQNEALIAEEWKVYRAKHADEPEAEARRNFEIIQRMSADHYDAGAAAWAERKALIRAWLEKEIEAGYMPANVSDATIREAVDAYAFGSGYPALVTVSHVLVREDERTSPQERWNALNAIREKIIAEGEYTDDALSRGAIELMKAGFGVDMNADLTFPLEEMKPFMNEQLYYRNVVDRFGKAAFALSDSNRLSPVTETEFGYHIILFKSRSEEKKADPVRDREFLVDKIVFQGRKLAFDQALYLLKKKSESTIGVNEDRINRMIQAAEESGSTGNLSNR